MADGFDYAVRKAATDAVAAALAAMVPPVAFTEHPAQDQKYPYVTLDRMLGRNQDILAATVVGFLVYLTVWSRARGPREAQNICTAIRAALNEASLVPATGHVIECRVTRTDVVRDGDGLTYMGSIELDILANP